MSRRRKQSDSGGVAVVLGLLVIIWLIIKLIWWILGALAIIAAFFVIGALVRRHQTAVAAQLQARAEVAARADQQHAWVLAGDDRGIYGPDGAALMHHIFGDARDEISWRTGG